MRRQFRTATIGWLAAACAFFATATRGAEPPAGSNSLLIRYRVVGTDNVTQVTSMSDGYIFRDGLVIERLTNDVGKCEITRASALPERLLILKKKLGENRVDIQQGDCISEPPGPFTVEREVTWFGRGKRQHSYRYGNHGPLGGSCPAEVIQIDLAISDVLGTATGTQREQTCP